MTRKAVLVPLPLLLALPVLPAPASPAGGLGPGHRPPAAPHEERGQGSGAAEGPPRGVIAVDRWLVSDPVATEGEAPAAAREAERIDPGEPDLFPDRDVEVGGTYWHLARRDSTLVFDLDELFPERPSAGLVYAHAYIRAPEDRTLTLGWEGASCGDVQARLNGLPLAPRPERSVPAAALGAAAPAAAPGGAAPAAAPGGAAPAAAPGGAAPAAEDAGAPAPGDGEDEVQGMAVRLAGGWNTLLLAVALGDCPARFGAWLSGSGDADAASREGPPGDGLQGIRVQASRPPGVRRTYPASWVTVSAATPPLELAWQAGAEGLTGHLVLGLAGWGAPSAEVERLPGARREEGEGRRPRVDFPDPERSRQERLRRQLLPPPPPPEPAPRQVRLDARARSRTHETLRLPPPGRASLVSLSFPFGDLRGAALSSSGAAELELRWRRDGDERSRRVELPLSPDALLRALHAPIPLTGWQPRTAPPAPAGRDGAAADPGHEIRGGEWRIPPFLSGFGLELRIEGAPGRYRVDGRPAPAEEGRVLLCRPCQEGARVAIDVEPEGEWTATPRARILEVGYPAAAGRDGSPQAEVWLRALRGRGNVEYLRLAAEHAPPAAR